MKSCISIFVVFFLIANTPPVPGDGRHQDPEENALINQGANQQVHLLDDYLSGFLR